MCPSNKISDSVPGRTASVGSENSEPQVSKVRVQLSQFPIGEKKKKKMKSY